MYFNEAGINGKVVRFSDLESIMHTLEIIRGGQWDWERVTYDHKYENRDTGDIYYLRVQGLAVKGEVEHPDAEIELKAPILGHHYYPHGVEYDEDFPEVLVKKCEAKLAQLQELLEDVQLVQSEPVQVQDVTQVLYHIDGVKNVGELHIWDNEEGKSVLSCHLIIADDHDANAVLQEAEGKLTESFGIGHTTIQIDREGAAQPAGSES